MMSTKTANSTTSFLQSIDRDICILTLKIETADDYEKKLHAKTRANAISCRWTLYRQLEKFYLGNISTEKLLEDIKP